jgi:hypothetical protein
MIACCLVIFPVDSPEIRAQCLDGKWGIEEIAFRVHDKGTHTIMIRYNDFVCYGPNDFERKGTIEFDTTLSPATVKLTFDDIPVPFHGIAEIRPDRIRLSISAGYLEPPSDFERPTEVDKYLWILRRLPSPQPTFRASGWRCCGFQNGKWLRNRRLRFPAGWHCRSS